jgi:hypothetical protein
MTTDPPAQTGQRYRPRTSQGREHRLSLRLSDDEHHDVITAAHCFGLTPTGFCAQAAVDTARNLRHNGEPPETERLSNLQAELFHARATLNQLHAELNLARNDRQASLGDLDEAVSRTARVVADLDGVVSRVHRRLGPGSAERWA